MIRNQAGQHVAAQMNSREDGTPLTTGVSVAVTKDGGTSTAGGGTLTHKANGHWDYEPTQGETDAAHVVFQFTHATGVNQVVQAYPRAAIPDVNVAQWRGAQPSELISGRVDANAQVVGDKTGYGLADGAITADKIAADAITSAKIADGALTAAKAAAGFFDAVWSVATRTLTSLGASLVQEIWDRATSALTTAGSIGKLLVDNINATIGSRSSHAAADVWAVATRVLTAGTNIVLAKGTGVTGFNDLDAAGVRGAVGLAAANLDAQLAALPTAEETADQVWDEAIADHLGVGSTGEALNAAGAAGDPWTTALPGAYGAGSAGHIVGNRLDAAVSTRAPEAGGNLAAVKAKTDQLGFTNANKVDASILSADDFAQGAADKVWSSATRTLTSFGSLAADVATAVWAAGTRTLTGFSTALAVAVWDVLESAIATASSIGVKVKTNLDAAVSTRAPESGGNVAAIKAKADALPADPASEATVAAVGAAVLTRAEPGDAMTLTGDERAAVADAVHDETMPELSQAQPPATPTLRQGLMLLYMSLRNRLTTTDDEMAIRNDAGDVVAKAALSDDGTTFAREKLASGP